jgi:hypothetical protein
MIQVQTHQNWSTFYQKLQKDSKIFWKSIHNINFLDKKKNLSSRRLFIFNFAWNFAKLKTEKSKIKKASKMFYYQT